MAGGELSEHEARSSLVQAAQSCGLEDDEIHLTIESGLKAGMRDPRQVSEPLGDRRGSGDAANDSLPLITWNEAQLPHITLQALDAIDTANKAGVTPYIFQRGGCLVRMGVDHSTPIRKGISRSPDAPTIYQVRSHYLQQHLTKVARWQKWNDRKNKYVDCACPKKVADTLLEMSGEYTVWPLHAIINAPTMLPDGSILERPGYDESTGIYFDPDGVRFSVVPQRPTEADVKQALKKLLAVISEFPFKTEADRSVALAYILTALVRRSLPTAPGTAFSATVMATGKTRLANIASHIAYGCPADNISYPNDETEMSKRVFSLLFEGAGVVVLDNLEQPLTSETLCTVLTEPTYKGRVLGKSEMQSVSTNVTWAATGNNLLLRGDITTRFLLCQLDAKMERPEERTFKRNLDEYISARRAKLVIAGLTILRAHFLATDKPQLTPFGRFEVWSDMVRSAVVWCGLPDPLVTRKEIDASDPVREALKAVLIAWHDEFGSQRMLVKDAIDGASQGCKSLVEALENAVDSRGLLSPRSVGKWLAKHKERRINGLRFVKAGDGPSGSYWCVKMD